MRAGSPRWSASITSRSQASSAIAALSPPRASRTTRVAPLGLLEVGEDQLGLDRLHVAAPGRRALGMDHVLVAVAAHDVQQRVGLADVGEELVAEALALVRAGDEPGDVVEVDRVRHDARRPTVRATASSRGSRTARRRRSARSW